MWIVCRDRLPQLNITFDMEDNVELTQKVRKRSATGMLEDNGGIERESEQKSGGDNFVGGGGGMGGGGGVGGEADGRGELEEREGQSNKMARSFMRQAYYQFY